jgi:hypothetical protein
MATPGGLPERAISLLVLFDVAFGCVVGAAVFFTPMVGTAEVDGVAAGGVGVPGTVGAFAAGAVSDEISKTRARTTTTRMIAAMTARSSPRRRLGRGLLCTGDAPSKVLDAPV